MLDQLNVARPRIVNGALVLVTSKSTLTQEKQSACLIGSHKLIWKRVCGPLQNIFLIIRFEQWDLFWKTKNIGDGHLWHCWIWIDPTVTLQWFLRTGWSYRHRYKREPVIFFWIKSGSTNLAPNFFLLMCAIVQNCRKECEAWLVFHLAALKHVILCERSPNQAVQSNITGVQNVISAAIENEVER